MNRQETARVLHIFHTVYRTEITDDIESLWANVFSFEVGPDNRIYLAVAQYQSDIWVMDLEY